MGVCQVDFCSGAQDVQTDLCDLTGSVCPEDWMHVGSDTGYCHGFRYEGSCRPLISLAELAFIGKAVFMEKCGVEFACKHAESRRSLSTSLLTASMAAPRGPISGEGRLYAIA